jgi:dihydropteroate synthase
MGIINITPDSFSGDGVMAHGDMVSGSLQMAEDFIRDGVDILDLGAESSRPGAQPVPVKQEMKRLLPALKAIRHEFPEIIISIDTCKAQTADACLDSGADWINDIFGLKSDEELAHTVADRQAGIIMMHNRSQAAAVVDHARLGRSYHAADYGDVIMDIRKDLDDSMQIARSAGVSTDAIILDPGLGFGKSVAHNLEILNRLNELKDVGFPLLIGPSRKSFIGLTLDLPVEERLEGTAAAVAIGIARGADIIRVHDVQAMVRVARMTDAIVRNTKPSGMGGSAP